MKDNAKISDNSIKIKSSRLVYWLLSIIGVVLIGTGFLVIRVVHPLNDIIIGAGIIMTSAGLMGYIHSEYYKIYLDNPPGFVTIIESTFKNITPVKIPLDYYSTIMLHHALQSHSKKSGSGYEVELMSRAGTTLVIAEDSIEETALDFAKKIQEKTGMDIILNSIPLPSRKTGKEVNITIDTGKSGALKYLKKGVDSIFSWKISKNPLYYLFALALVYGFFHIVYFALIPYIDNMILYITAFGFLILFCGFIAVSVFFNLLGTTYLIVSPDSIGTFTGIFGKKIREREVAKNDIGLIRNSVSGQNRNIMIITKRGLTYAQELLNKNDIDIRDISGVMNLGIEIIDIPSSSLTINEKLFIELEIVRTILR